MSDKNKCTNPIASEKIIRNPYISKNRVTTQQIKPHIAATQEEEEGFLSGVKDRSNVGQCSSSSVWYQRKGDKAGSGKQCLTFWAVAVAFSVVVVVHGWVATSVLGGDDGGGSWLGERRR